jgi:predicted O-methyltransferase YrrM
MIAKRALIAAMATAFLGCTSIESSPIARNDEEGRILEVLAEMAANEGGGMRNVSPEDGRLLRLLTEATDAKHVVEIGTSNGYSGIWFCLALRATDGRLTTHEIDAGRAALARANFERAGVDRLVTLVEGDAHEEVTKLQGPIDILFLDADKSGYIDYLEKLLPLMPPGGLVLAHNMQRNMADPKYLEAITSNPDLETIFLHRSLFGGVGVTLKKRGP